MMISLKLQENWPMLTAYNNNGGNMKKHQIAETGNVLKANKIVDLLINRKKSEMVGLGLIWGAPGLGKTRYAFRTALNRGYIYYRLDATATQKTFLRDLMELLQYKLGIATSMVKGSKHHVYEMVREYLSDNSDFVIFIDEIDYAFKSKELLSTIRDLADETESTFILVGMQNAYNELLKSNSH